jgi:hypothetical protein
MRVRNRFGREVNIPDNATPEFLKAQELYPIRDTPSPQYVQKGETFPKIPDAPLVLNPEPKVVNNEDLNPVFESLIKQVPEEVSDPDEVLIYINELPGFENFPEADVEAFLAYRASKLESENYGD